MSEDEFNVHKLLAGSPHSQKPQVWFGFCLVDRLPVHAGIASSPASILIVSDGQSLDGQTNINV